MDRLPALVRLLDLTHLELRPEARLDGADAHRRLYVTA
jgi:hypothetical protein